MIGFEGSFETWRGLDLKTLENVKTWGESEFGDFGDFDDLAGSGCEDFRGFEDLGGIWT